MDSCNVPCQCSLKNIVETPNLQLQSFESVQDNYFLQEIKVMLLLKVTIAETMVSQLINCIDPISVIRKIKLIIGDTMVFAAEVKMY